MFSSWIMSIVIIACVGVLLDIIIPEGEMEKYVKGIFSILVIFVIISPLPAILKKDWSLELESYGTETVTVDQKFIESLKEDEYKNEETKLSATLIQKFGTCDVNVIRNNLGEIVFVIVDFTKTGISENHTNNINVDSVKEEVKNLFGISLEQVIVYE